MKPTLTILGNDPSLTSWGLALVEVDIDTLEMNAKAIHLIKTEKSKNKTIRASSDKLLRARKLAMEFSEWEAKANLHAAEIPSGAQSANAAYAFGLVVGVISHHRRPLIEVTPTEVKKSVTGYAGASKEEMVEWATTQFPHLDWPKGKKYCDKFAGDSEHMADALAIVHTAIRTESFRAAASMMQSALAA